MKIAGRRKVRPVVPVNAMSDIAFLLLIFIMLISLLNYRREVPIQYPEATQTEVTQAEANLEIWVTADGAYVYEGRSVSAAEVEAILAREIAENPSSRIHILADRRTEYRRVDEIVQTLQLLQHRVVSLVVREREGES